MQQHVLDGRPIAYRQVRGDGDGPTILYVHGSGGTHQVWAHQYAHRGPSHPAIAIDLPGHGESADVSVEPGPATLTRYAADVAAVARECGVDVLVGHSMGGAVLFEVLLEELYEPDAAVFAGTGAKLIVDDQIQSLLDRDFEELVAFLHQDSRLLSEPEDRLLERSKATLRETGQAVTRRDFLSCHEFDVRDRLAEITIPTLAIVGEQDSLTPPAIHASLAEQLPTCDLATVEDAAHLAMLEQPRAFNTAVAEFVTSWL